MPASMTTEPRRVPEVCAATLPLIQIRPPLAGSTNSALPADWPSMVLLRISMWPPRANTLPLLLMPPVQFSTQFERPKPLPETVTWVRPSPKKSRVTWLVAPNTTLPRFAVIVPELSM